MAFESEIDRWREKRDLQRFLRKSALGRRQSGREWLVFRRHALLPLGFLRRGEATMRCDYKRGGGWCDAPSCPRLSLSVCVSLEQVDGQQWGVRRPCTCSACRAAACSRFLTAPAPAADPCSANEATNEDDSAVTRFPSSFPPSSGEDTRTTTFSGDYAPRSSVSSYRFHGGTFADKESFILV